MCAASTKSMRICDVVAKMIDFMLFWSCIWYTKKPIIVKCDIWSIMTAADTSICAVVVILITRNDWRRRRCFPGNLSTFMIVVPKKSIRSGDAVARWQVTDNADVLVIVCHLRYIDFMSSLTRASTHSLWSSLGKITQNGISLRESICESPKYRISLFITIWSCSGSFRFIPQSLPRPISRTYPGLKHIYRRF